MRRLQAITGVAAILLLSACAPAGMHVSDGGTVTGRLQIEGGPIGPGGQQPGKRPMSGTVQFTGTRQQRITVPVGSSGTFSVRLAPGTYAVCWRSPAAQGPCSESRPVTVTARHTTEIAFILLAP
jgi:hypothetical protein